ncbi:MAG: hypothetical protein IPQ27_09730 [Chitinophagaceae bacterium]|nr:hypothetical protein [Chitinophagaceae bacterium]
MKAVKDTDKEIAITEFKLDRTEKVKRTTAILLEETIAELEQKRKDVEAQNRDLEIEAALEKVRSRSLAMQKSDELAALSLELVKQVQALGVATWFCAFNIYGENDSLEWGSNGQGTFEKYVTPREGVFLRYYEAGQRGETLLINEIGEDECPTHYEYLCSLPGVGDQLLQMKAAGIPFPASQIDHVAFHKYGYLIFITYKPVPEAHDIFKRFAKVFEQTYTRFLDLQKAEAQAREAQIETSLERVRSRSMAMHKSDELKEVIRLVLEQFVHLKINAEHAGFYIDYKAHDDMHIWLADPNLEPFFAVVPYFDTPTWNSFLEAKTRGTTFHPDLLDFEEKNKFYHSLFQLFTIPEEAKQFYMQCKGLAVSTVMLDNVGLYIENFDAIPFSEEENKILMRFGKVFQQTYTRFLDLQKAEAQAREAQIEAALERVRSRTMAMHKSDELLPTADLLFDQLKQLGAELQGVAFAICDKNNTMVQKWTSIGIFSHPYNIEPGEQRMYEAWKIQAGLYEEIYEGEKQKKYYESFMEIPAFRQGLQKLIDSGQPMPTWQKNHAVTFKYGYLLIITTKPFTETQIFLRFGKVFEQTYTRFLDLQKAEAQAREAKIETALERVRSRTLAMQKSDELAETAAVLFQQLILLGIEPNRLYICIAQKRNGDVEFGLQMKTAAK